MSNTIRIRRRASGGSNDGPTTLKSAELAFHEGTNILYYGSGTSGALNPPDAASVITIGGSGAFVNLSGNQTITGVKTINGTLALGGATLSGDATFSDNLVVSGNLTVNGVTTTINSTTVSTDDKNIVLADTASPSDTTSDGGGITLRGSTDKTFNWLDLTDAWTSSEHIDLASNKAYYINGVSVLSGNTLGSGVTTSSLTSVGTIGTGTWQGSTIATGYGGTGQTSYTDGQLLIGNTAGGLTKATLTAGTGVSITNGNGTITINAADQQTAGDGLDLNAGVFSVDLKANGGLVIESTELAVDLSASSITGTLAIGDGGTGSTTANDARTALGLAIGVNVQAWDTDLDTLSGMQTGAATALAALTSAEVAIIDGDTSATATTLSLADRMVVNDNGTMVQVALSDLVTFLEDNAASGFDLDGGTF